MTRTTLHVNNTTHELSLDSRLTLHRTAPTRPTLSRTGTYRPNDGGQG